MITAIIPIPQRVKPNTKLNGKFDIVMEDVSGMRSVVPHGRDIIVPPLFFYKFFSSWKGVSYEHVFATDEIFDICTLQSHISAFTEQPMPHASLLCPISVKRITQLETHTYLFNKSIQYLFRYYRFGIPLRATNGMLSDQLLTDQTLTEADTTNVLSYGEFLTHAALNTTRNEQERAQLTIPKLLHHLTLDSPSNVSEQLTDIMYYKNNLAVMLEYVKDLGDNKNLSLTDYIEQYSYIRNIDDPTTRICIGNGPLISSDLLVPFLENRSVLLQNYNILSHEVSQIRDVDFIYLDIAHSDAGYLWTLLTEINELPYTDYSLFLDDNTFIPLCENRFPTTINTPSLLELKNLLHYLFINKNTYRQQYVSVEFNKTWADEIFICCTTIHGVKTFYYLNLALFRLTSPSLVNCVLFQ